MKKLFYIFSFCFLLTACNLSRTNYKLCDKTMLPSISVGSYLKITKQFDKLNYGDIVVYNYDGIVDEGEEMRRFRKELKTDEYLEIHGHGIYRVVGLPGDSIAVENNICVINGEKNKSGLIRKEPSNKDLSEIERLYLEECKEVLPNGIAIHIFRYSSEYPYLPFAEENRRNMQTIKVPENHYFLMKDFRCNAYDSRYIGTAPREEIIGKVIKITPKNK